MVVFKNFSTLVLLFLLATIIEWSSIALSQASCPPAGQQRIVGMMEEIANLSQRAALNGRIDLFMRRMLELSNEVQSLPLACQALLQNQSGFSGVYPMGGSSGNFDGGNFYKDGDTLIGPGVACDSTGCY